MTLDIIGAGIGGLTTAIALKQKGINTRIYEQSKAIKPVGAGIILANNAMQVYDKLGLRKEIEQNGNFISSIHVVDAQLNEISGMGLKYFEEKYQVKNIAIHRGALQKILLDKLDTDNIYLDSKLSKVTKEETKYQLSFANGNVINSEAIIGADGLNSKVRNCLFSENTIRNSHQVCWRGVIDYTLPKKYRNELNEVWGKAGRFGFVQISPSKIYWFAVKSFKNTPEEFPVDQLTSYYGDFHSLIQDIIQKTPVQSIHTDILSDLKPIKKWHQENVCLIGDAAHATTPNMGQGACQSIEDAYILSECIAKFKLNKAFEEFQKMRIKKAHNVVNTSWTIGKIAHWTNPIATSFRNSLARMTPESVNIKQTDKLFQLEIV